MNIGIVGGSLQGILISLYLAPEHNVTLFELDAEIGTPAWHPGYIIDTTLLEPFLTKDQRNFLLMKKNPSGWGMRWEWLMKHFTILAAQKGVHLRTRTRICQTTQDGAITIVETSTNETSQPTVFPFHHLINTQIPTQKPGGLQHTIGEGHCIDFPFPETVPWFGGIISANHLPSTLPNSPSLLLHRDDNLVELWWNNMNYWKPPKGYLEEMRTNLPNDVLHTSFDSLHHQTLDFIETRLRTAHLV